MRIPVIAGNWKMNNTIEESRTLVYELSSGLKEIINVVSFAGWCNTVSSIWK